MTLPPALGRRAALQMGAALAAAGAAGWTPRQPAAAATAAATTRRPAAASLTAQTPASLALVALNRMAFGPRPGSFDFDTFAARAGATDADKLLDFIEWQLYPNPADDADYLARRAAAGFVTLGKNLPQWWTDHVRNATGSNGSNLRFQPARETRADTLLRGVYSQWQLAEVLTHFWHNHFSVYAWDTAIAPVWAHYDRDVIRANLFGNFRVFLEAVAKSPAMLLFLDNFLNQDGGPNENYARELFELHTLGAENYLGAALQQPEVPGFPSPIGYVDADVYEATRCFTGWRYHDGQSGDSVNDGTFFYYDAWHDRFQKRILGYEIPANQAPEYDGQKVLDLLADHPGVARFISRKLCRRLVSDTPSDALVAGAAQVFAAARSAPDQLRQVVRHILRSDDFRAAWGQKLKTPAEAALSLLRATRAEYQPNAAQEFTVTDPLWSRYDAMGQPLFGRRSPDGYPDTRDAWIGTTSLLFRWRLCNDLLEDRLKTTINGAPALHTRADVGAQTPAGLTTPSALLDFWVARLFGPGFSLPAVSREELLKLLSGSYPNPPAETPLTAPQIADRVKRMVALLVMGPDFQWR